MSAETPFTDENGQSLTIGFARSRGRSSALARQEAGQDNRRR